MKNENERFRNERRRRSWRRIRYLRILYFPGFTAQKQLQENVQNTDTDAEAKKEEEEEEEEKARARREKVERRAAAPLRAQSIERASTLSP